MKTELWHRPREGGEVLIPNMDDEHLSNVIQGHHRAAVEHGWESETARRHLWALPPYLAEARFRGWKIHRELEEQTRSAAIEEALNRSCVPQTDGERFEEYGLEPHDFPRGFGAEEEDLPYGLGPY